MEEEGKGDTNTTESLCLCVEIHIYAVHVVCGIVCVVRGVVYVSSCVACPCVNECVRISKVKNNVYDGEKQNTKTGVHSEGVR